MKVVLSHSTDIEVAALSATVKCMYEETGDSRPHARPQDISVTAELQRSKQWVRSSGADAILILEGNQ